MDCFRGWEWLHAGLESLRNLPEITGFYPLSAIVKFPLVLIQKAARSAGAIVRALSGGYAGATKQFRASLSGDAASTRTAGGLGNSCGVCYLVKKNRRRS